MLKSTAFGCLVKHAYLCLANKPDNVVLVIMNRLSDQNKT